ncbi:c-type cytochrome domain-containing protein [Luteolibacter sp. AS25]|uniref:WD40 domain-containing protein n=1 Tax=Luteolibacter sp. AS25 TaxID=3135776 RepID=UPI00398B9D1F
MTAAIGILKTRQSSPRIITLMRSLLPFLFLSTGLPAQEEKISFEDHVFPIFEQSCLNCHNPDKNKGGLDLSTYSATIRGGSSGKIVEAGDTSSTLVNLVNHSAEPVMPPEGEKLSSEQISILEKWIENGLLETKSSKAKAPSKPKFETALRSDPSAKPEGPPPMPQDLLLDPPVVTEKSSAVHGIATSPWAPLLAITGQKQILLHHTGTLQLIGILPFPEGTPTSLTFTPDARYLIVGGGVPGKNGTTVTFDITTGQRSLTIGKEFDTILATDIRPSFDIVATGGPSKLLKLWDTQTGEQLHSIKKHTDWITALDISPDGKQLASGDRNGGIHVWESKSGNEIHSLRGHESSITALSYRADSKILASASEDGTLRFWEPNNGNEIKKITAHKGGITDLAFSPDGHLITVGRDQKARLWKPDFNKLREFTLPALPTAAAIDWEKKYAFIADATGKVHALQFGGKKDAKPLSIPTNPPSIATRLQRIAENIKTAKPEQLPSLRQQQNHWQAAAINTETIYKTQTLEALDLEKARDLDQFRETLTQLDQLTNSLRSSRNLSRHFAESLKNAPEAHLPEAEITHHALEASSANQSGILHQKELELFFIRNQTDTRSREIAQIRAAIQLLEKQYRDTLTNR